MKNRDMDKPAADSQLFTVAERERVEARVLQLADADECIVAGAVVGSLATGPGDRWSDLDLTFAVAAGVPITAVLEEWTCVLAAEFNAAHLFDLPSGPSIYRVFLLPGCLQFDLSFTPAAQFGAAGPQFRLLFGSATARPYPQPPSAHELFGYAVHHAVRARFCLERGRLWQAEYWVSGVRDYGLSLACLRRGLPTAYGRGFDQLPPAVLAGFGSALVAALDRAELLRALGCAVAALLAEAEPVRTLAEQVEPALRLLGAEGEG